jgi:hypothetical protein
VGKSKGMTGALAGGPVGFLVGSSMDAADKQARAAQNAAMAQQAAAQANYNETASIINPASVQALTSLDRDIANQDKNLSRQEQLISQLDPTIIEASQQALKLLRGEQSSTLAPVQAQRTQQRQKLVNSLREQLGPGAETSTAGIQALTRFDSETNNLMAGQQQSALAGLGNVSSQFSSQRPDMFREIMGLSSLGQQKFGVESQRASMLSNARAGLQQTAGAQYTGDLLRAQSQQAQINQVMQLGGTAAGFAVGGPGGAAAGSTLGGVLGGGSASQSSGGGFYDPSRYAGSLTGGGR